MLKPNPGHKAEEKEQLQEEEQGRQVIGDSLIHCIHYPLHILQCMWCVSCIVLVCMIVYTYVCYARSMRLPFQVTPVPII